MKTDRIRLFGILGIGILYCIVLGVMMIRPDTSTKEGTTINSVKAAPESVTDSDYQFLLVAKDNYVEILEADAKTLYDVTGISLENLPQSIRYEILEGKPIYSEKELYDFLENFSS